MNDVMISFNGVTKKFGKTTAVDCVSLSVKKGEVFSFLGLNGAGKTTSIKMLVGVLQPTSGEISIDGFDLVKQARQAKAMTGYIPDRPNLYDKLTAREFLYFVSQLYGLCGSEQEARIDMLLEEYGLNEWQNELTENYSHGMKQRLSTSAALLNSPRLLVIDEPMVGLDPRGARLIKEKMRDYAKSGMTVFLSTHSLQVAEEVSDRLAVIDRGRIVAVGTMDDLHRQAGGDSSTLESTFLKLTKSDDVEV